MKIKRDALKVMLVFLTFLSIGCSTPSHSAKYPNEAPHSAAPITGEAGTEHQEVLGSTPSFSQQVPASVKYVEKRHPRPIYGVKHYFGEEHGGVHSGPHGEPTP